MKILTNSNIIFGQIEKLIENSKEFLYLISPYIEFEIKDRDSYNKFKKAISLAIKNNIKINFISRLPDAYFKGDPKEILKQFTDKGCNLYLVPNLHSKIYCNESKALITSMNMYLHSVINNEEIGVKISKKNELKDYENVTYYIEKLIEKSDKSKNVDPKLETISTKYNQIDNAFCILCKKGIPFNKFKSLCYDCFIEFKHFNPIHGKYCHKCGKKDLNVDHLYPLCYDCYRKLYR